MSDHSRLIERLREAAKKPNGWAILGAQAATETADALEAQAREIAELRERFYASNRAIAAAERERDEARALLREARDSLNDIVTAPERITERLSTTLWWEPAVALLARIDAALKEKP